jgi:hypothetical protein
MSLERVAKIVRNGWGAKEGWSVITREKESSEGCGQRRKELK